jgi:hypothetical protein
MPAPIPVSHLKRYAAVYPDAWAQAAELRKLWVKMPDHRPWCFLPLAGAYAIVNEAARREEVPATTAVIDVGNLGALISWRMTQGIYRFDPTLYESLWNTPLDGDLPIDVLYRMPEWCVWIETPNDLAVKSPGFFAYLEYDVNTSRAELRLVISDGERLAGQILHLTQSNLVDCIEEAYQEGLRQAEKAGQGLEADAVKHGAVIAEALKGMIAPRLSLLLYLCTVNSDIADSRGSDRRPSNPKPIRVKDKKKLVAASTPTGWDVGVRIGAAIRAAQERERTEARGGTHASPRPHVRRAHWHTYLVGAGRQERLLKWLPPIPVSLDDSGLPAVLRDVK